MNVDRTAFLFLSAALAGGCQPPPSSPADKPPETPEPAPVASILIEPSQLPTAKQPEPESASAEAHACQRFAVDSDCPEDSAHVFCERYQREFLPDVAGAATDCLASLSESASSCGSCDLSRCGMRALEGAGGEPDSGCASVEKRCKDMRALCERYSRGMNSIGRERFRACLIDHCGVGVRFCLWDPSVSSCIEGQPRSDDPWSFRTDQLSNSICSPPSQQRAHPRVVRFADRSHLDIRQDSFLRAICPAMV